MLAIVAALLVVGTAVATPVAPTSYLANISIDITYVGLRICGVTPLDL